MSFIKMKEKSRDKIRKYFPDLDISKPMSREDRRYLMLAIEKLERLSDGVEACKKALTLSPGDTVCHIIYGTRIIKKITSNGKLMLEGLSGNYSPAQWKKVLPEE